MSFSDQEIKNLLLFKDATSTDSTPTEGNGLITPPNRCENPDISESVFEESSALPIESPVQEFSGCGLTDLSPPQYSQLFHGFGL